MRYTKILIISISMIMFGCNNSETFTESKELIIAWNENLNQKNFNSLSELYSENILYYGEKKNKNSCISDKKRFLKKNESFSQKIPIDKIKVKEQTPGIYECTFEKEVTIRGISKTYPSYIVIKKLNDILKIVTEGDEITDKVLEKKFVEDGLTIQGDFNGDGRKEKLSEILFDTESKKFMSKENIYSNDFDFNSMIYTKLNSSDNRVQSLILEEAYLGLYILNNEGDLDGDGGDEISFLLEYQTSVWHSLFLYTLKDNEWKMVYPATVITIEVDSYNNTYEKGNNKGEIIVNEFEDWGQVREKVIKESGDDYEIIESNKIERLL